MGVRVFVGVAMYDDAMDQPTPRTTLTTGQPTTRCAHTGNARDTTSAQVHDGGTDHTRITTKQTPHSFKHVHKHCSLFTCAKH